MLRQPENEPKKYAFLFNDIDVGRIKIPMFQRDFVWTNEQTAKLIDSIIQGLPNRFVHFVADPRGIAAHQEHWECGLARCPKGRTRLVRP